MQEQVKFGIELVDPYIVTHSRAVGGQMHLLTSCAASAVLASNTTPMVVIAAYKIGISSACIDGTYLDQNFSRC